MQGAADDTYITTPSYYLEDQMTKDFNQRFQRQFQRPADAYVAFGYDSLMLLAEAMKQGATPEEIQEALMTVQYNGLMGSSMVACPLWKWEVAIWNLATPTSIVYVSLGAANDLPPEPVPPVMLVRLPV